MILTKEEKIDVVKMVLESYKGITLTEAKSNNEIREVIKKNLIFYSGIKESLGPLMEGGGIWGDNIKRVRNRKRLSNRNHSSKKIH